MRVTGFIILFAVIGLAIGYGIYGKINDKYVDPLQIFAPRDGVVGRGIETIHRLEEKRTGILIAGAIGVVVGIFVGVITGTKKKTKE